MKRIFVACLLLILAVPASGQRVSSPYRFLEHVQAAGAYAGYLNTSEGLLHAGPKSAPTFGVHWGYAISGPVRLTAEAGLTPPREPCVIQYSSRPIRCFVQWVRRTCCC